MKQNVLREILIESQQPYSICIFDIDSTLFNVSGRTQAILRQILKDPLLKDSCAPYQQVFKNLEVHEKDFGIKNILKTEGIHLNSDLYKNIYSFWSKNFFSPRFLEYDTVYKGASSYLNQLNQQGTEVMYLTGRTRNVMGKATLKQLKDFKLPLRVPENLMMKEIFDVEDSFSKKNHLEKLLKKYSNIWFFENEPSVINFIDIYFPQIQIVFMNSVHSGRQKLRKKFLEISSFDML